MSAFARRGNPQRKANTNLQNEKSAGTKTCAFLMAYVDQLSGMRPKPQRPRQMKSITPTNANATPTAKALREFVSPMLCLLFVDINHYDRFVSFEKRFL
ncbi:hypothetical protein [uncultured Agrobacterium sp.]|uniref:hypothetical protein n=1 Tax=uncultured Agrobacterium sp. TaxID=157277 RepID=UPI0025829F2E|nr:hypothetical protein [uncultured Agrobacterium sp.]